MKICKKEVNGFKKANLYMEIATGELFIYVKYTEGLMNLKSGLLRLPLGDLNIADYIDVTDKYCLQKVK